MHVVDEAVEGMAVEASEVCAVEAEDRFEVAKIIYGEAIVTLGLGSRG